MLQYYHHLVAIFTLRSALVINVIVLGLIMKESRLHVSGFQASRRIHSDTVWSEMRKQISDLTVWHFNDKKHKTNQVERYLVKTEQMQVS